MYFFSSSSTMSSIYSSLKPVRSLKIFKGASSKKSEVIFNILLLSSDKYKNLLFMTSCILEDIILIFPFDFKIFIYSVRKNVFPSVSSYILSNIFLFAGCLG